jgi:microcystin-dependent protein
MSNVLPLTIRPGALPPNATYTPQQFLDVLATALQIESQSQFALFVSGAVEPVFNAGPFLRDGITWRVWKDSLGAYGPLVMEQESLRYAVSFTAPDETKYDFWIRLDGAGKGQGVFKYFGAAWVDVYSDIFYSKAQIDTAIAGALPVGTMLPFAGAAAPTGYLICNGAAQSRATFAQLFALIGTTYGAGDLLTTFNIPDFRGRALVGVGTGTAVGATAWTLGEQAGEEADVMKSIGGISKNQLAFAWVRWSVSGGIQGSYNVENVVFNGGSPRITFATPAPSVNYAVVANGAMNLGGGEITFYPLTRTINDVVLRGSHAAGFDPASLMDAVIYVEDPAVFGATKVVPVIAANMIIKT